MQAQTPVHSDRIRNLLDKENVSYEAITQESSVDITSCDSDENTEAILVTDFLTRVYKFREIAPKGFVAEVLAFMQGEECSMRKGDKTFFNNDWQAIFVPKLYKEQ